MNSKGILNLVEKVEHGLSCANGYFTGKVTDADTVSQVGEVGFLKRNYRQIAVVTT